MIGRPKLVLASGSPRRLSLINQAGIEPDALKPADIDETPKRGELPRAYATRLAWSDATPGNAARIRLTTGGGLDERDTSGIGLHANDLQFSTRTGVADIAKSRRAR